MNDREKALEAFEKWTGDGEQTPNWEEENNDHYILQWVEKHQETIRAALSNSSEIPNSSEALVIFDESYTGPVKSFVAGREVYKEEYRFTKEDRETIRTAIQTF